MGCGQRIPIFPVIRDDIFGYVLHTADLATNKAMAAAGRREVRDIVDLVTVHETILPLGDVVWAAVEKAPGYTPEGLIAEIRRNSNYPAAEWRSLISAEPIDPKVTMSKLRGGALDDTEAICLEDAYGQTRILFSEAGQAVQPHPERLNSYEHHAGRIRGHWPSSTEITICPAVCDSSAKIR